MPEAPKKSRGGARKGAGRPKGSRDKINVLPDEKRVAIIASGNDPVDFLISVMRNDEFTLGMRMRAAESALPYVRAQLKSIQHTGRDGGAIEFVISDKDRARALAAFVAKTKGTK